MLPPSRERAVCFEEKVACVARFERAHSYPDARRLFGGSWSGAGGRPFELSYRNCRLFIPECEGPRTVSLPTDANGIG